MKFDINAARDAGYSDNEIADYLAKENNFDLGGALKSGYSASEIVSFLSGGASSAPAPALDTGDDMRRMLARNPAPKPAPYQNRTEALDDALFMLEEGAVPQDQIKSAFGKAGIKWSEIVAHGKSRGSDYFKQQSVAPAKSPSPVLDPEAERMSKLHPAPATAEARPWEPSALEEISNTFKRGVLQAKKEADTLKFQAGVIDAPTYAERVRESERRMGAVAPSGDVVAGLERLQKANQSGNYWDVAKELLSPSNFKATAALVVESAIPSMANAPYTVAAGLAGGPIGAGAAAGATSFAAEYASALDDTLEKKGVNKSDPVAVRRAIEDPEVMNEARERGIKRGIPVAAFDAISAGFAGRFIKTLERASEATGKAATRGLIAAASGKEAALQVGSGMAGEAGGQILTGENKPLDVLIEGLAELPGGVSEVATNVMSGKIGKTNQQSAKTFDAEQMARDRGFLTPTQTPTTTVNFTAPDSPTSQAGLTPIVVPVPTEQPAADTGITLPPVNPETEREFGLDTLRMGGATPVASQQPAGLARPFARATDQDLLTRTEAAVAAKADNNAVAQPTEQWFGRKGDGYSTEADAMQAIAGRQRMFKGLDWKVELMPNGKYRLAGYEQNVQVPTETSTAATTGGELPAAGTAVPAVEAAGVTTQPATAPITLHRVTRKEFDWNRKKPQGVYASIVDNPNTFESPFGDEKADGAIDHRIQYTPKNPLVTPPTTVTHARFGSFRSGNASAGVAALKMMLPEREFAGALRMSKDQVIDEINRRYPDVDTSRVHDSYEALEIWGAQAANQAGHDVIIHRDPDMPNFSEAVLLDRARVKVPAETAPSTDVTQPAYTRSVFRGSGRKDQGSVYNGGTTPILGSANYYALDEKTASKYGPNIESRDVSLNNPLVIDSDQKWKKLTREAGWSFPNPQGQGDEETQRNVDRLQKIVRDQGHDGVVIDFDPNYQYDELPDGRGIKTLRNVFGDPQVIVFNNAAAETKTTNGTQTPQAIQSQAQGQEVLAASAKQPGDLNLPQGPLPDAVLDELSRNPGAANTRAAVQGYLNNLVASGLMPEAPKLGTPDADAEATVNVLGNLFGDTTGIGSRVVAYNNPGGENGFSMRGFAFVNTAPDTDVSAPRTTLHEIRHVIERIAQADTKAGLTNTPAQQFTASIDSIFDEMTDAGKRAYVENFLHKEDLDAITNPAEREAAVQKFMASPLLRSEMGADFLGNRAQDRAFLIDLAKADPKGFEGFVKKWLAVIDNLLAKLKGSKTQDHKESAKVDQYVRDLNKAKMVARDALIAFRKGNLSEMAAQQEQEQDQTVAASQRQEGIDPKPAPAADVRKAKAYEEENGILPYTSAGQIEVPVDTMVGPVLFSIKQEGKYGNHPLFDIPVNKNGTVTLYYPATNAEARRVAKEKTLRAAPGSNRIYLTNESSAPRVITSPGNIEQALEGANVLVQVDPSLLQLDMEHSDGRKDFFIPLAEGKEFFRKMRMTRLFTQNAPRTKALTKDTKLTDLERRISDGVQKYLSLTKGEQRIRLKEAKTLLKNEHNVTTLMGVNGKLEKTNTGGYGLNNYEGKDVKSMGLGLASAQKINENNLSTCPKSAICESLCLGETSGQNLLYGGDGQFKSGPRLSQYLKTEAMVVHPEEFAIVLHSEIAKLQRDAQKEDYQATVRLNVTSDFRPQTFKGIIEAFPDVMFYDYTKLPSKAIADNHHLTYSSTGASQVVNGKTIVNPESNWNKMVDVMRRGDNVAMAFSDKNTMPKYVVDEKSGERFQVWNGDNYDARFLDPKPGQEGNEFGKGMIIGLTNKDRTGKPEQAAEKNRGFFIDYNPERDGDTVVIKNQDFLAANTKFVPIKVQRRAEASEDVPAMSRRQGAATPAVKELITIHNLSAENLRAADELGGLPAPSLAIAKASAPLEGFGEITLIGGTDLATPSAKNPVFDADVYSPRFPDVRVKVDEKLVKAAIKPLSDAAQAAGMSPRSADSAIDEMALNRLSNAIGDLSYDTALRLGYANAVLGKNITVPTKQVAAAEPTAKAGAPIIEQSPLREVLPTLNVGQLTPETAGDLGQKVYAALVNKTLADMSADGGAPDFDKAMSLVNRRIRLFAETTVEPGSKEFAIDKVGKMTDKGLYALYNLTRNTQPTMSAPAGPRTEMDTVALSETLDREAPREQFSEWLREQLRPAMGVRRIVREGGATAPFSLANIVREMTRKVRDAEGFNYGLGNARSKGATKFKNLKQIQGQRDRVVSKEKFEAARKEIDAEFSELANQVAPFQQYKGDSSVELLAEAIGNSYSVPLAQALQDAALINVPGDLQARIAEFAGALVNAPTEYFEAKPQRAVTLDEFRGAVVPKNLAPQAAEILAKHGVETIEYDPKQTGDRQAKVAELASKLNDESGDIMFSRRQPAAVDQDPELITIFEDLQNGRGLKAVRAKEAAAEHPLGDAIQKVHNDFYDILERLDNAGLIEINC